MLVVPGYTWEVVKLDKILEPEMREYYVWRKSKVQKTQKVQKTLSVCELTAELYERGSATQPVLAGPAQPVLWASPFDEPVALAAEQAEEVKDGEPTLSHEPEPVALAAP